MKPDNVSPPPVYLILRVLCGGCLIYTAWDLREAAGRSGVFLAAALVFLAVGLALGGSALWTLARHPYFRTGKDHETSNEDTEHDG